MRLSELYQYILPSEDVRLNVMRDNGSIDVVTDVTSLEYIDSGIKDYWNYEIHRIVAYNDADYGAAYLDIYLKDINMRDDTVMTVTQTV